MKSSSFVLPRWRSALKEQIPYQQYLTDESLKLFLAAMRKFDQAFLDHMADGDDFTLKLEVHGNCGKLIHARTSVDGFKRPRGVEKELESRRLKKVV